MAITKSTYSNSTVISPFLVKVSKNANTNIVIIVDETPEYTRASVDQNVVWIKVEADYRLTVLNSAPGGATSLGVHNNLSSSLVKIKGGEVFVTAHASTPQADNNQTAVTGYAFGTFDKVYLKIDRVNDTITVYEAPDNA